LNEPQVPTGLHVQSTPFFVVSLVTVAVNGVAWFTSNEDGALNVTVGTVIVVMPAIVFVLSAVEAAVMVTLLPVGAEAGAV